MTSTINVVVVLDDEVDRTLVEGAIPAAGRINVAGVVESINEATRALQDRSVDLLVVGCRGASEGATAVVRHSTGERPDRPIVALCESPPEYFVHSLFEAGVDDVVKLPEAPGRVGFALEKAVARHQSQAAEGRGELAPMICVLGPKGGTGKTVAASNLVVGLAEAGARAAVVDLDLQFGDVGLALGLEPRSTVYDLATSGGALDADKLGAYLATHDSGARALLAPMRPDQASTVSTELMRDVLALLRATHDYVVVDTPPDFTPQVIAAVDASSHVCMVGMLDALSLKNTRLGLETLDLMGYDRNSIAFVLNRSDSHVGLTREDVEAIIGRKPDVLVPSDRDVPLSLNEGRPIVIAKKRSHVAAAFRDLAAFYNGNHAGGNGAGPSSAVPRRRRRLRSRTKG
jgi:pilus assembly protein CpaE